ncbi:diguanylate cyclase [Aureimonas sp. Leaf454]|uniref:EAL domain-containing protein n=1 Tax=Aureimonas sp. Leaf454 TaxID=1736381 RepID=UPI0006F728DE|nr:EAL domain-containing protein [Aureimonas sp. Leaf454]KQT53097.1 diguanylate cyclase [Aureimonas sp. Leaf454]
MFLTLSRLAAEHSIASVVVALAICLVAGSLLGELLRRSRRVAGPSRAVWLAGTAIVAGLGVWTTHFVAVLGYRPDLPIRYGLQLTAVSALIGVVAVGVPLAATVCFRDRRAAAALGALAGLGIGAMHFTGMTALDGCVQVQSPETAILACLVGAVILGAGRGVARFANSNRMTCLLFTAAVCGTHFTAISGLTLTGRAGSDGRAADHTVLGLLVLLGAVVIFVGALMALLSARRFDAQERAHATILSTALQNMSNGLVFVDGAGRLELFNERFREMFAIPSEDLRIGMSVHQLIGAMAKAGNWTGETRSSCRQRMLGHLRSNPQDAADHVLPDGRIAAVDSNPVQGGGVVITFDDVTAARSAQRELSHLAFHDALTGLGNRRAFGQRLAQAFASGASVHLLVLDLDRFKIVNDTYGHAVGDQLLVQAAERLVAVVGTEGFVGRLGGDEMAVISIGDLRAASEMSRDIVEAAATPFRIGDLTTTIGCSIGIAAGADCQSSDEWMQRADIALYEAKRQGRGRFAIYRSGMQEAAAKRHRMILDLRSALGNGELHLAYQPVVSLGSNEIVGYEALLRWDHPDLGSISPSVFVPLAEESDQIVTIGAWVLEEACRTAAGWSDGRHVAVNVSTAQFRSPLLRAHIVGALARSGLPAHRLEIELTETALVEDGAQIAHLLSDLRRLGIKIAMDDFGTGYSSLAHMRDFPVDRIKIDRSFVASAEGDRHSLAVIKAVLLMGRDLDIETLAEGVETESQLSLLRDLGCGSVQGYLLGRPARLDGARAAAGPARASA